MTIELSRKIINLIPPKLSLMLLNAVFHIKYGTLIKENIKKVDYYRVKDKTENGNNAERDVFFRNLRDFCVYNSHVGADKYIQSYFEGTPLQEIRRGCVAKEEISDAKPILICCVKNDLERVQHVVSHHRIIGVTHMVFVDNGSSDGTREWLERQEVDLFFVDEDYHAGRKGAWIRKVQDIYGYNRWYLIVDSDELFSYVGMEEHPIQDLIKYVEKSGTYRVRSMLLDMYPNHQLYQRTDEEDYDFEKDYRYFDVDSYYEAKDGRGYMMRGGPRKRVFERDLDHSEPLTKYPLLYVKFGDIWSDHRPLPYKENFKAPSVSVLRHYKFMSGDMERYSKIISAGQYYDNSINYKAYVKGGRNVIFYTANSVKYMNSSTLKCLSFMESVIWQ